MLTPHTIGLVLGFLGLLLLRFAARDAAASRLRDATLTLAATVLVAETMTTAMDLGLPRPPLQPTMLPDPIVASGRNWYLRRDVVRARDERVLIGVVGDSFVAGEGVGPGETLSDDLTRALAARGLDVDVRNLGVQGRSFFSETFAYTTMLSSLNPDVVVWVFVLNDFGTGPGVSGLDLVLDRRPPTPTGLRVVDAVRQAWDDRRATQTTEAAYHEALDPDSSRWTTSKELLTAITRERQRAGGRVIVAIYPLMHALDAYPFVDEHRRLVAWAQSTGAEVVDLLPTFVGRDASTLWASQMDHHPNRVAHQLASDRLMETVEAGPLRRAGPIRCDELPGLADLVVPMRRACEERDADSLMALAKAAAASATPYDEIDGLRTLGEVALLAGYRSRGTPREAEAHADVDAFLESLASTIHYPAPPPPP